MASTLKSVTDDTTSSSSTGTGTDKWNAMTDEQKQTTFDRLPAEQKQGKSYYEWLKDGYHHQVTNWMPWIEDQYLRWFTNDNKASYATKDSLSKTKVTGVEQVDNLQDSANSAVASQFGQGGVLQPVGDAVSKEGVNRAERGGNDDTGKDATGGYGSAVVNGASNVGSSVWSGAKSAGGYVGGILGGGGKEEEKSDGK